MIVMMIAITPSLKASNRPVRIFRLRYVSKAAPPVVDRTTAFASNKLTRAPVRCGHFYKGSHQFDSLTTIADLFVASRGKAPPGARGRPRDTSELAAGGAAAIPLGGDGPE